MIADLEFIAKLPKMELDLELKPCPRCQAAPNRPGHHKGPTTLYFSKARYQTLCLACGYRALPGSSQAEAMQNWEDDNTERLMLKLRKARGLSQLELATLAGVDDATVSNLERGVYRGSYSTRNKLARVLGTTAAEL